MRILIDLSEEIATAARRLAQAAGISRKEWIEQTIVQATGLAAPELMLGFWQIAGGELDGATCADCEQPLASGAWLGITSAYRIVGPLCASCARTD
jgi:hypothetical protein